MGNCGKLLIIAEYNMELKYDNDIHEAEAVKTEGGYSVSIDGVEFSATATAANRNTLIFRSEGRTVTAFAAQDGDNYYVVIDGRPFVFEKPKDEDKSYDEATSNDNRQEVAPPMPGSVVKLEVEKGQSVKEGESLVIVEAMKMETSLFASIDGIVTEINVEAGQQVDSDTILCVVEKPEE
jgi:biotin carboxyl carrier protein